MKLIYICVLIRSGGFQRWISFFSSTWYEETEEVDDEPVAGTTKVGKSMLTNRKRKQETSRA